MPREAFNHVIVSEVLKQHELWLNSDRRQGRRADFTNGDLKDFNLRNADLRGAIFKNALLWGASLNDARLAGADLSGADLTGASLQGADLRSADLTGAILICTDLSNAQFAGIRGDFFHMYGCKISLSNLILIPDWAELLEVVSIIDDESVARPVDQI